MLKTRYSRILFVLGLGLILALLWLVRSPGMGRAAGPWYVAPDGDDDDNCLSPSTPCATINAAIAKADSGDTIYVAIGMYTGDGSDEVVVIDKDITLSGGWEFGTLVLQSGISTIDGEESRRGITVNSGVTATVEYFVVQNGVHVFYYDGAGISSSGNLTLKNSSITGNAGNGLYLYSNMSPSDATLISNIIADNDGHGLYLASATATLINNIVADNAGNGLYISGSSARLLHTTIAHNTGGDGSGIYVRSGFMMPPSTAALTNTILVSQTTGIYVESGNTAGLEGTLWGSGAWANGSDWGGDGTIVTGTVNLWGNPDFESPGNGDYHIGPDSAALDTGVNAGVDDDIDGDSRPQGSGHDIGADERADTILRLHKTAWSLTLNPGETLTYTLGITSTGVEAATGVWLTDTLPALQRAADITTTHGSCTASAGWGGTTTCDLGTMASGDSAYITLTAQVTTTPPTQLPVLMRNTAWVKAIETTSKSAYADTTLHDCHVQLNDSLTEYETVQAAVDASTQPADIVKVAGTCTGVTWRDGAAQIAYLSKTLTLQGGWNTAFTQRNVISFPTTLDARGQGRVMYITGEVSPTIEGLRITGGTTNPGGDPGWEDDDGGGIYVGRATATISNNRVFGNIAPMGGGLYLYHSDATLSGNTIFSNTSIYYDESGGGGLYLEDSPATLISNMITNNTTDEGYGGGLYLDWSDATLINNTITNNIANQAYGGGLYLEDSAATLNGNTVSDNVASYTGGLFLYGSDATLSNNTISGNTSGGLYLHHSDAVLNGNTIGSNTDSGLYLDGSDVVLNGNTISSNTGTGLSVSDSDATISDNIISGNTGDGLSLEHNSNATINGNTISFNIGNGLSLGDFDFGGDATLNGNTIISNIGDGLYLGWSNATLINNIIADNAGRGLYINDSSPRLLHTTIARNGGASGIYVDYGSVALTNTILVSHTVGVYVTDGNTATLEGTLWGSGIWANGSDWDGDGTVVTGTVNLWDDPDFANPTGGDYHIGAGSVAVDAGVASGITADMDGDPRPAAFGYDIGADERPGASLHLLKTASPLLLNPSQMVTYTLVVTSVGADTATDVWLTDTLPVLQRAVTITTTRGSCTASVGWGGDTACNLGTMVPGDSAHITFTAQVTTTLPTQLPWPMRNTVWVAAAEASNTTYADTTLHDCHVRINDSSTEYSTVQSAVDASTQPSDVLKAAGYCIGVTSRRGVAQIAYISKTLTLQGGWNTAFTQRDVVSYPTTLDARGQGRVLYITGDISFTVEGLRITGGRPGSDYDDGGGGVYVISATATIRDNQIFSNTTAHGGGGLSLCNSDIVLDDNTISGNVATDSGSGGLYLEGSEGTFTGNTISFNTANGYGGGLSLSWSSITLIENTVSGNSATADGGGLHTDGNAMLIGNTISGNTADDDGGGLSMWGSGVTLIWNTISGNTATNTGGGLILANTDATLNGNTVISNTAENGGGLSLYYSAPTLVNNIIANNQTNNVGSGLYIWDSSPRLLHTTIARNTGGDGSGVYVDSGNAVLTNTILVSHTMGVYIAGGNTATMEGTLWGSGIWANESDWVGDGDIITGTVNLWGDPAFVDPDAGDYHITLDSAAVNAGVNAGVPDDIDGDMRTDGSPDIGADEFSVSALVVTKQATPDPVQSGGQLTYTIRITNTGTVTLTATVTDTLPDDITQGQTPDGTLIVPNGTLTWTPVIIVPRDVWSYTFVVTVELGYTGPLTNVVEVTTDQDAAGDYTLVSNAVSAPFNQAPYVPTTPIPADGASNVPITQTLSWQGGDPDIGDTVTYTIVISTSGSPLVVDTTVLTNYTPSLITNTTYYWAITATDGISITAGPTWRFATVGFEYIYLPLVMRNFP